MTNNNAFQIVTWRQTDNSLPYAQGIESFEDVCLKLTVLSS